MKKIELKKTSEFIEIKCDGKIITNYYFSSKYPKPFLYPVLDPNGNCITRHYPMKKVEGETTDHIHHRSIWTAFGDVNGVDIWEEKKHYGRIITKKFLKLSGGEFAHIIVLNHWVSEYNNKVMDEEREIKIYNLDNDEKIFDFNIKFKSNIDNVKFGDTKEGGIISVRVATSMDGDKGGKIENSEGKIGEKDCWGKKAKWCDYSGNVCNKIVGIAIFDHPENLKPAYWHVRNYGLFAVNPFGLSYFENNPNKRGDFILEKGKEGIFKYRIIIHRGDAKESNLEKRYAAYLNSKVE